VFDDLESKGSSREIVKIRVEGWSNLGVGWTRAE